MASHGHWDYEAMFKILVIGQSGVGKSSMQNKYTEGQIGFPYNRRCDFTTKIIDIDGKRYKLQIWDTMGQERFRMISRGYFRGAHGCLLVYDVTDEESFAKVNQGLEQIREHAQSTIKIILVGNKCDLVDCRTVPYETAKGYADENNLPLIEVSAKDGTNIELTFTQLSAFIKSAYEHKEFLFNPPLPPLTRHAGNKVNGRNGDTWSSYISEKCEIS